MKNKEAFENWLKQYPLELQKSTSKSLTEYLDNVGGDAWEACENELIPKIEQFCADLNLAHNEIVKLQGKDPQDFDWPSWTPQANSIRWAEKLIGKKLAKTNIWTLYPEILEKGK